MAFTANKRKNLETAQKYAQKGQYDKALKEYQRLLKSDPKDANLRLKIGDLYLKLGEPSRAIEAYTQVAEEFSKGGFDAKAVAIYKQILRVNEEHLEARISLGDHFQRMGLRSDALREFQAAVELCQRRELKREAFDLLKRVASLDPGNVPNRLHLADLLLREKLEREAREEYSSLLAEVAPNGDAEATVRVAEQTLRGFPEHREALIALVGARMKLGQAKEALESLDRVREHHAGDVEVLEARIHVLEALDDPEAAQRAWFELAEAHKKRGDVEKARDVLQRHATPAALVVDDTSSHSILLTDATGKPDDLDPDPAFDVTGDSDVRSAAAASMSIQELLAEARVSYEFGDPAEARKLARVVLDREPEHAEALELIARIGGPPAGRLDATPEFDLDAPALAEEVGATAPDGSVSLPDIEIVLEDEADRDDAYASVDPPSELGLAPPEGSEDEPIEFEIDLDDEVAAAAAPQPAKPQVPPAVRAEPAGAADAAAALDIAESLEEAEFYLAQGLHDEAELLLRRIVEAVPNHPKAMLRLGELERRHAPGPAEPIPEIPEVDITGRAPRPPQLPIPELAEEPVLETPAAERSDECWELPVDDASGTAASGELVAQIESPPEAPLPPAASEAPAVFDPAEWLDTSGNLPREDEVEAPPAEAGVHATAAEEGAFDLARELEESGASEGTEPSDRASSAFDEVFRDFKRGIQQQIGEEDADAHYDLAIAYKEMGLIEDALRELATVQRQGVRLVETLSLMATCKLELGRAREAITDLKGALQIAGAGQSQLSLRYELGLALIAVGKPAEALAQFKRVAADDPGYRDVQDRISELQ